MTEEKITLVHADDASIAAALIGLGVLMAIIVGVWSVIRYVKK